MQLEIDHNELLALACALDILQQQDERMSEKFKKAGLHDFAAGRLNTIANLFLKLNQLKQSMGTIRFEDGHDTAINEGTE